MSGPPEARPPSLPGAHERGARLDSWKEIAAYLNRDIRTVQRWEKSASLPVRRLQKPGLRAVFAYTADLDDWLRLQSPATVTGPSEVASAIIPQQHSQLRRWIAYGAILILLLAGAGFSVWRFRPEPFGPLTSRPITSDPGSERDPDISPDGKYVAYSYVFPDLHTRLQVRLIEGGEPHAITSAPENEWSPAWSPDGGRIAFLRGDPSGTATLLITSALGGEERKVADVHPYSRRRTLLVGHLLAWTPDGRYLIVPDRPTAEKGQLFLVSVETGQRFPLTSPSPSEFDVEPSVSTNGRLLVFNRVRSEFLSDVFVQRLDRSFHADGAPRKLPPAGNWNGTPRLLEKRDEVLVCAGSLPRLSLWRQSVNGSGPPVSLGIIGDYSVQSAVHQPTGRIVSRTYRGQADVLRFPIDTARTAKPQLPPVEPFLESSFMERSAVYSPDGSQIAFISDRTGRRQLWVSDGSGQKPTEWTQKFEADPLPPTWSNDGSKILFIGSSPAGLSQLYVADRTTRAAARITNDALDYSRSAWSHDGKYVYASASDKSVYGIYRLPGSGGAAERILSEYRYVAGVEPSGKGLYIAKREKRNQSKLYYVPLPSGPAVQIATMNFAEDAWVTAEGVYYLNQLADKPLAPVSLYFRTHTGVVRLLHEYSKPPGRGLSVSPGGRFALTALVTPPISDLMLLEAAK